MKPGQSLLCTFSRSKGTNDGEITEGYAHILGHDMKM